MPVAKTPHQADSGGRCDTAASWCGQETSEALGWDSLAARLAGPGVEFGDDGVEVVPGVD